MYSPCPSFSFSIYEVFGRNTGYVIDPKKCLADNFAMAMFFGMEGPEGEGYPSPEIIDGILSYLRAE
ncbi:MAG: hypothetical protein IIZ39_10350 [Blautia sp.]|nr:hypothetical protein [Blautia sp.]